ncbi:MAG: Re/Si-specific NAD(P)(+) transhydrogenase subunit alpha [Myxococcota bacterium]
MIIGIPREVLAGERRVALVPDAVKSLIDLGLEVLVQTGAGEESGFADGEYEDAGARLASEAAQVLGGADVILKVQPPQPISSADNSHEVDLITEGAALVALLKPLDALEVTERLAKRRVSAFAMEFMPRITRAQSMDALSSQSNLAGYEAVLLASTALPRIFPMMVTAAGTLQPSRILVIGAGVAGLQALGTAKRLGGITYAYDTRPVVKEQVESLGARFVELDLDTGDAEDAGGYATAQSDDFYQRQRDLLGEHVAKSDVVITTALVPGQEAPLLIEETAVQAMRRGSVIVDLAAEKGGNCALTEADKVVVKHGVTIMGHTNLPAKVPANASQLYAKNLVTFLDHLLEEGQLKFDLEDEITSGTLITHEGKVIHERIRSLLDERGAAKVEN